MARRKSQTLTDGELRIMDVIWRLEEATVRDVTDELGDVAYNTVQTMLRILDEKGYVTYRKDGRAFVYRALVNRGDARAAALKHLLGRFFGGSRTALVENLLRDDDLDAMEIDRLKRLVRNAEDPPE